ncbi:MAG: hypothetical protein ACYC8T_00815 [Myxococcaceae bacterium]
MLICAYLSVPGENALHVIRFAGLMMVLAVSALAADADGGTAVPVLRLQLREDRARHRIEVTLPPAIPLDRPFILHSWVPSDVLSVGVSYWRSTSATCQREGTVADVARVLDETYWYHDDDVALSLAHRLTDAQLDQLASTANGKQLLEELRADLSHGFTSDPEQRELERILAAPRGPPDAGLEFLPLFPEDEIDPAVPIDAALISRTDGGTTGRYVEVYVPQLNEPWWDYCFQFSFWSRNSSHRRVTPAQVMTFVSALKSIETRGRAATEDVREAAITAGLLEGCEPALTSRWDDRRNCERALNAVASDLEQNLLLFAVTARAAELRSAVANWHVNGREALPGLALADYEALVRLTLEVPVPDSEALREVRMVSDLEAERAGAIAAVAAITGRQPADALDALKVAFSNARSKADACVRGERGKVPDADARAQAKKDIELANQRVLTLRSMFEAVRKAKLDKLDTLLKKMGTAPDRDLLNQLKGAIATGKTLEEALAAILGAAVVEAVSATAAAVVQDSVAEKHEQNARECELFGEETEELETGFYALKAGLSSAAALLSSQRVARTQFASGSHGQSAPQHVDRARGFFSTDVGLAGMYVGFPGEAGGSLVPMSFVQLSMSFGQIDFNSGLGAVDPPRDTGALRRLGWELGQRLTVSLGLALNTRPVRSPDGELGGLFGSSAAFGTVGAGFRVTEFVKLNLGAVLATTQPDLPGVGVRTYAFPFLGLSLDFPVYRVVGRALQPVFGTQYSALEARLPQDP